MILEDAQRAVDAANALGAIDFVIEAAGRESMTLLAYLDDTTSARGRITFEAPSYVQLPWQLSWRVLRVAELALESAHAVGPTSLGSLPPEDLGELATEGALLFTFEDPYGTPQDPPGYVVARRIIVTTGSRSPTAVVGDEVSPGGETPLEFSARYRPGFSFSHTAAWELRVRTDDVPHFSWDRLEAGSNKRARKPRHVAAQPGLLLRLAALFNLIPPRDLSSASRVDDAATYEVVLRTTQSSRTMTVVDWPELLDALPEPTRTAVRRLVAVLGQLASGSGVVG